MFRILSFLDTVSWASESEVLSPYCSTLACGNGVGIGGGVETDVVLEVATSSTSLFVGPQLRNWKREELCMHDSS
jgi:hypothetical protein